MKQSTVVHAERALLPAGWASDVRFTICEGRFEAVEIGVEAPKQAFRAGTVIPGIANLHSHAFQRILAGMSERRDAGADAFMSWRTTMYNSLERLTPELLEDLCAFIYARMVRFGYTNVAEFHYLHRDQKGQKYGNPAELSLRVVTAARKAGIGITHLPVVYEYGGFNRRSLSPSQVRLQCSAEDAFTIAESVRAEFKSDSAVGIGMAPHSLRAVDHGSIDTIADMVRSLAPAAPIHIHVSEQREEVQQCIAHYNKNPIELLAAGTTLDPRWVLVHCTHATARDFKMIAEAGAVVALCPMTEANLGDGHVRLPALLAARANFGIGSDSQVALDPKIEWLMLEYSQRLLECQRNVASDQGFSVGRRLLEASSTSAAQALGRAVGKLAVGCQADIVELDTKNPAFDRVDDDRVLDVWVFAADMPVVTNVMVAGEWIVTNGAHRAEQQLRQRYEIALDHIRG